MEYDFCFLIWEGKFQDKKWAVVDDNSFWTGDDNGLAQKCMDPVLQFLYAGSHIFIVLTGRKMSVTQSLKRW